MELSNHYPGWLSLSSQPPVQSAAGNPAPERATPDAPLGCGWFDSSYDLQRGLAVCEHDHINAVANDLPVDVWVHWHLASATNS